MTLLNLVNQEIKIVQKREKSVNAELKNKPKGKIRVTRNKNSYAYYHCTNNSRGEYIKMADIDLISALSSKEYLEMIKRSDQKLLKLLKKLKKNIENEDWQSKISKIHKAKLSKVNSKILSDKEFAKNWSLENYQKMENYVYSYPTLKGDYARSKTEVMIMDFMYTHNIYYRYEQTFITKNGEYFSPDFTLINPHTRELLYWEHFGMMNNPDYAERAMHKILEYQRNGLKQGINLLCTFETTENPFSISIVKDFLLENFAV